MHRGFIKLWRCITDSEVFVSPQLLKVWIWCLSKAAYQHTTVRHLIPSNGAIVNVDLEPGQFIFGRHSAAQELGMKAPTVRNCISRLKALGNVDIRTGRQFSVVSICNWDTYSSGENPQIAKEDIPKDMPLGRPKDIPLDTKKKDKKDKKKSTTSTSDDLKDREERFISAWNQLEGVRKVRGKSLGEKRRKAFRTRLKDEAWAEEAAEAFAKFPLKCFEGTDSWTPNAEWFLRPDTVGAILEGKYDWTKGGGEPEETKCLPPTDEDLEAWRP